MENCLDRVNNPLLILCSQHQAVTLVPSSLSHPHHQCDPCYQMSVVRAWFAISHGPGRTSICSSCHVRLSNCTFRPPKFLVSAEYQATQVASENCICGDSSMLTQRSSDSASKKIQIWLCTVWSHFFAYTIWLFVSNTYIVSVTVTVMRKRISSLRGRKQKGGRIQHACGFSEPLSPFGMEEQCV